jgi:phosphoglycolate phosphatase-like HAD superfamily hydrolase
MTKLNTMKYTDIDPRKTTFIFELDNVLYPEKDYLFQAYYLFAGYLEYLDLIDEKEAVEIMVDAFNQNGKEAVFSAVQEKYNLNDNYKIHFEFVMKTAKLPLKLLLFQKMLELLQDIIVNRKKLFIVTNGKPEQQLNKIKQTEWHGLEKYLVCYFADEIVAKPEPDVINNILRDHNLRRNDIVMIGNSDNDLLCAEASGVDYINVGQFL